MHDSCCVETRRKYPKRSMAYHAKSGHEDTLKFIFHMLNETYLSFQPLAVIVPSIALCVSL